MKTSNPTPEALVALRRALEMAVRQNEHDMLLTGDELRECHAALAASKAEGRTGCACDPSGSEGVACPGSDGRPYCVGSGHKDDVRERLLAGGGEECPNCGAPCTTKECGRIDPMWGDLRYTAYTYKPAAGAVPEGFIAKVQAANRAQHPLAREVLLEEAVAALAAAAKGVGRG